MFQNARIKLTAWYLVIIMLISIFFSILIYGVINTEVERFARLQQSRIQISSQDSKRLMPELAVPPTYFPANIIYPDLLVDTKHRIISILFSINGIILLLSGTLAYFLSGRTLRPIKIMVDDQNRFIADASHELRTPLTAMKSSMEVNLRDRNLTIAQARELIRENIDDVNRLQLLSDSLLQLGQLQSANTKIKNNKVSILDVLDAAIAGTSPLAKEKNIKLNLKVDSLYIFGDKDSLTHLFVILIDNAIKYSNSHKSVNITSSVSDGFVDISVKDFGVGISPKNLPKIFDRFYRVDNTRTNITGSGYGLGLSIAQKIVSSHFGTISVRSKLHSGSTFTVKLPRSSQSSA